ncbi:MAG: imidazolonepropionase [Bacteroidetes bacterium]|nr:imidazolonepropionase [Bacteroidota bacterium]
MSLLIKNIKSLAGIEEKGREIFSGKEMSSVGCLDDSFLIISDDKISEFGTMEQFRISDFGSQISEEIDASGKFVLPCWVDSHTHLVFASSREQEFMDRLHGLSYQEIANRGGGILNSANKLRAASEEELYESAWNRLNEIMMQGTGAVEIKSGYGLDKASELKMLNVISRLKKNHPLTIQSTFLGAHAVPLEYKDNKEKYMDLLISEMLPEIAEKKLADYCDVFCEEGYFTKAETIRILEAAKGYGILPKVHAEQLSHSGGIEAGVETGAISVDHLEYCNDKDISLLKNSVTMPTILPGAQFFLQLPFPPARKMIDAGLPLAIASDYNPGSSPSGNMNLMVALACIQYQLTPEEAINAATINSAYAMGISKTHGTITKGKKANVFITKEIPSLAYLPYSFGNTLIETVIINGKIENRS